MYNAYYRSCGVYSEIISAQEAKEICPLLRMDDIVVSLTPLHFMCIHIMHCHLLLINTYLSLGTKLSPQSHITQLWYQITM